MPQVNRTVTVVLAPAAIVTGNAGLTIVNAGLLEAMAEMVNAAVPVLFTVKVCVWFWPRQTLPKLSVAGETVPAMRTQLPVIGIGAHSGAVFKQFCAGLVTKLRLPVFGPG